MNGFLTMSILNVLNKIDIDFQFYRFKRNNTVCIRIYLKYVVFKVK